MQADELDIVGALGFLQRTVKETIKLSATPLEQWQNYAATVKGITEDDGEQVYQGQVLKEYAHAKLSILRRTPCCLLHKYNG